MSVREQQQHQYFRQSLVEEPLTAPFTNATSPDYQASYTVAHANLIPYRDGLSHTCLVDRVGGAGGEGGKVVGAASLIVFYLL